MKGLKNLGMYIHDKREAACMSLETLSDMTGVSVKQIELIEAGNPKCGFHELQTLAWWFTIRVMIKVPAKAKTKQATLKRG